MCDHTEISYKLVLHFRRIVFQSTYHCRVCWFGHTRGWILCPPPRYRTKSTMYDLPNFFILFWLAFGGDLPMFAELLLLLLSQPMVTLSLLVKLFLGSAKRRHDYFLILFRECMGEDWREEWRTQMGALCFTSVWPFYVFGLCSCGHWTGEGKD